MKTAKEIIETANAIGDEVKTVAFFNRLGINLFKFFPGGFSAGGILPTRHRDNLIYPDEKEKP